MNYTPCCQRVFPFKLAPRFTACYESYLYWIKQLLVRLGRDCTLLVWRNAYQDYDDKLLVQILSTEWYKVAEEDRVDVENEITRLLSNIFSEPVEGHVRRRSKTDNRNDAAYVPDQTTLFLPEPMETAICF